MTISSVGYDGTIDEVQWAGLTKMVGSPYAVGDYGHFAVTPVSGIDRTVSIAAGKAYGHGVLDTNSGALTVQLATLASGVRWDTIAIRRDWSPAGGTSTVVGITGTSSQVLASSLNANPGVLDDQPIALVKIVAGQQVPAAVVDLRTFPSKVITTSSLLALPDAPFGTEAVVGGARYRRELDATNSIAWVPTRRAGLAVSSYSTPWSAYPGVAPGYVLSDDGVVTLSGLIGRSGSAVYDNLTQHRIATAVPAIRPTGGTRYFLCNTRGGFMELMLQVDGAMYLRPRGDVTVNDGWWVSLDGIAFPL